MERHWVAFEDVVASTAILGAPLCWFVLLSNEHSDGVPHRVWIICHTDDCRVAADHMSDAVYVSDAFSD
eukprot:SAG11_NODE_16195_length_554_cov_4.564835_1_plen_68_part_10